MVLASDVAFPRVSIVIPAWNEEGRLPETLERYLPLFERQGTSFEFIVVADGVSDGTAFVAEAYARRGVKVLRFPRRLGKGGAIIEGIRVTRYERVGFLDADGPVSADEVQRLVMELESHEGAVATRHLPRNGSRPSYLTLHRYVLSKCWNVLTRLVLGMRISDTQCGAKFFRRLSLMDVVPRVALTNWAFDVSLLMHFTKAGHSLTEVPVEWRHNPGSKLRIERVAPLMLLSLIGIRLMSSRVPSESMGLWFKKFQGFLESSS